MSILMRVDNGHKETLFRNEQGPKSLCMVNSITNACGLCFGFQPILVNQVCLVSDKNQIYATTLSLC